MKHALVTGAGGFIGRRLCGALQRRGVTVTALHRCARAGPWSAEVLCDLAREAPGRGALAAVDTVFHLAGHAHAEPAAGDGALHRRTSVDGTARLLDALGDGVRRIVYCSSVKAMGECTPADGVDELAEPAPTTAYGRARLAAERLVLAFDGPAAATVLRLPVVYGRGSRGNLARMLRAARSGRLPLLPDFGNRRSMVHVDDVCDAALGCLDVPVCHGRVYLLSDGPGYGTQEIQRLMYEVLGRGAPRWQVPAPVLAGAARAGDALRALGWRGAPFHGEALARLSQSACYRSDRARAEFGFAPRRTLRDGLVEMAASAEPAA